jgi:hypothetical protein
LPTIEVILRSDVRIPSMVTISIHFWKILTSSWILMPRVVTITTIFVISDRVRCCTLSAIVSLQLRWLLILGILHELIRMLLQWSRLNLAFSELFPRSNTSSWDSLHRDRTFWPKHWSACIVIISIKVVEEQVGILMVSIKMVYYLSFLIDSYSDTSTLIGKIIFGVKILTLRSYLMDEILLFLVLLLLHCSWKSELFLTKWISTTLLGLRWLLKPLLLAYYPLIPEYFDPPTMTIVFVLVLVLNENVLTHSLIHNGV